MARLWGLYLDRGRWTIRRGVERLPIDKYRRIRHDESCLREYVLRLNAPVLAKTQIDFKHAFINDTLLSEYQEYLLAQVPTQRSALAEFQQLRSYFLNYFIGKLNLINPLEWHQVHKSKWAQWLLTGTVSVAGPNGTVVEKPVPKAAHTKKLIVLAANRFMAWLHEKRPEEVPELKFKPLTKARLKEVEAKRELDNEVRDRTNISDEHLKRIQEALKNPANRFHFLLPFFELGLAYGLRRNEVLGLRSGDTRNDCLRVERQLIKLLPEPKYGPLKGRDARDIPHWFSKNAKTYSLVEQIQSLLINPTTLSKKWRQFMESLSLDYDFHDLRHTFITKAMATRKPKSVQEAAGHKHISTTMKYTHVVKKLDSGVFRPAV